MLNTCHIGDCRTLLREFAAAGVRAQTCITSPPYWGLRDYGAATGQIGLEPTFDAWLANVLDVFRAVRDVLTDDGTLWVNMGDTYNAGTSAKRKAPKTDVDVGGWNDAEIDTGARVAFPGLKAKDLCGQPWRLAFALQADGWYLRQDIIWHKPNPMPETLSDRCTKAHEYLFLLSKAPRYFYDFDAMQEPVSGNGHTRHTTKMPDGWNTADGAHGSFHPEGRERGRRKLAAAGSGTKNNDSFDAAVSVVPERRNKRSVWTVPTEAFSGAHFATFPTALIEPCVLAGSRKGDVVLDPFMGSGTTAQVAEHLGRQWIGCELQPDYVPLQSLRLAQRAMAL